MSGLGKSFQRSKREKQRATRREYQHLVDAERDAAFEAERLQRGGTADTKKGALKSIWETNALEDFLDIADRREEGYVAERGVRVVIDGKVHVIQNDKVVPQAEADEGVTRHNWLELSEQLTIPRRPPWTYDMSAEKIQADEKAAFTDWRRTLSQMEEKHKVVMTPYEKNLEVWRQLWRVVERADVVAVIVDARNPLIFRSKDFESYVSETSNKAGTPKKVILLLNKSDLLTEGQRKAWAEYFQSKGDTFFFFSAVTLEEEGADGTGAQVAPDSESDGEASDVAGGETPLTKAQEATALRSITRTKKEKSRHKTKTLRAPVEVANAYALAEQRRALKEQLRQPKPKEEKPLTSEELARNERIAEMAPLEPWSVLNPIQLLDRLALLRGECGVADDDIPLMVGLVGYPNVGKSSTINALIGAKKVVVSATPGKTKHFQTLSIPEERRVGLCDCPGLVFPSFASTKEQMVCDGILPVDTVTDGLRAAAVLCRRLPREVLERKLNLSLLPEDDVDESHSLAERLLNAMARRRGYMAAHGRPNRTRAAKDLLKLYVDGHLLYAEPPPSYRPDPATDLSLERFLAERTVRPVRHGDGYGSDDDAERVDDWDTDEDEAWAELEEAHDERALSEFGDDERNLDSDDEDADAVPPMFFARPPGARGRFTRQEFFNLEGNEARMAVKAVAKRRKKRTNHQLEPDMYTFINKEGEVELRIDDDDGVLELVDAAGRPARPRVQAKKPTKKQERRAAKRAGGAMPVNPSARRIGIQDY